MDPVTAAILLSGGINALQGKRGSDLLKSTISDAALAYATGGAGEAEGISTLEGIDDLGQVGINQYANTGIAQQLGNTALQGETFAARDAMNAGDYMQYASNVQTPSSTQSIGSQIGSAVGSTLESGSKAINQGLDFFRKTDPNTGKILASGDYDRGKVLLGAGALGAGLYASGAFKPTPPPEPKYPGYNRFYASDPSMFRPFSGNYGPDTSKYPAGAPYSGLAEGGIASEDDVNKTAIQRLYEQAQSRFMPQLEESDPLKGLSGISNMSMPAAEVTAASAPVMGMDTISERLPEAIKRKYIMEYKTDPNGTALRFAQEMSDNDRLSLSDINTAKKLLDSMSENVKMPANDLKGILGLLGENEVNVPKAPDSPAYVQKLIELIQAKSVNEPNKTFANGDLVDVLPSKLIRNENDEMNYKRTSGKMVVDETGKGKGNKDTMLAQLADGEFVTKSESVLGAGKLMGGKSKEEQRKLGAQFFYKQMAELEKFV